MAETGSAVGTQSAVSVNGLKRPWAHGLNDRRDREDTMNNLRMWLSDGSALAKLPWRRTLAGVGAMFLAVAPITAQAQAPKRPNIVMLMTDDTGWSDFGAYSGGGAALGHPTPNVDRIAKEGAVFTNWYGQASCTAGRASFITGRIPIRSALSIVVAPGDENSIRAETPTIAQFFQKNNYTTYFSGKWHLGDKAAAYPIEHGFDEMKNFAAYYAGVYAYNNTDKWFHPWFPSYNPEFLKMSTSAVNVAEWAGVAGQPAHNDGTITYDSLATFDIRQTDSAVDYIKQHATGDKPFFMDVNFIKMHNPTNAAPEFRGRSHLGDYSDSLMELDSDIGQSWIPSARWRRTPSLSSPPTTEPGWMPILMPAPLRSAARKGRLSKAVGVCPVSCGGRAISPPAPNSAR